MATELGISLSVWAKYENGSMDFSTRVIERIREATGIDPYVLAYDLYYNASKYPESIRKFHAQLKDAWMAELEAMNPAVRLVQ